MQIRLHCNFFSQIRKQSCCFSPSSFLIPCTNVSLISRSRAIFNSPSLEDLGTFSCVVTNTDGISSSYTLTEEGESAHSLGISRPLLQKLDSHVICLGDISAKGVRRA